MAFGCLFSCWLTTCVCGGLFMNHGKPFFRHSNNKAHEKKSLYNLFTVKNYLDSTTTLVVLAEHRATKRMRYEIHSPFEDKVLFSKNRGKHALKSVAFPISPWSAGWSMSWSPKTTEYGQKYFFVLKKQCSSE